MDLNHYVFRSVWTVKAAKADVFDVLEDLGSYAEWWPEIRRAQRLGEDSFELVCRSLLPYDLVFRSAQKQRDRVGGVLEATLTGDLEGFSRWTLTSDGAMSTAVFEEEVIANKALLRRLAMVARPAFKANHALMMAHGQAGLRVYLAGYDRARNASRNESSRA
jgi:Polyketide cyclase / dehydrase and lipid transport